MAGSVQPFTPASTVTVAASTIATPVSYTAASGVDTLLVTNPLDVVALVTVNGTVMPVLPVSRALFYVGPLNGSASVILSAGSGTVYLTLGTGSAHC